MSAVQTGRKNNSHIVYGFENSVFRMYHPAGTIVRCVMKESVLRHIQHHMGHLNERIVNGGGNAVGWIVK